MRSANRRCGTPLHRRFTPGLDACGFSLLELLVVILVAGIVTTLTVPALLSTMHRSRGAAAARYLAGRIAALRGQAVSRARNIALRFDSDGSGVRFAAYGDGNGNGVRITDIDSGVDVLLEPAVSISDLFPGVVIGESRAGEGLDGVRLGGSPLLSFAPSGTSTSGSIYLLARDDSRWMVRVLGATGRVRVLRYDDTSGNWVTAL